MAGQRLLQVRAGRVYDTAGAARPIFYSSRRRIVEIR
jgi:hypothetical protein